MYHRYLNMLVSRARVSRCARHRRATTTRGGGARAHVELCVWRALWDRRPRDQPGGHAGGGVAPAPVCARARHRGEVGHAQREGPCVRPRARGERVARRGGAIRDGRQVSRLLPYQT